MRRAQQNYLPALRWKAAGLVAFCWLHISRSRAILQPTCKAALMFAIAASRRLVAGRVDVNIVFALGHSLDLA